MPVDPPSSSKSGDRPPDLRFAREDFELATTPMDLKVRLAEQRLSIMWKDGSRSEFALAQLRRACPCATCRTDREAQKGNPLHVLKIKPADVRVVAAQLVGHYAIQFTWSDGHNTGIFDFRMLKQLA